MEPRRPRGHVVRTTTTPTQNPKTTPQPVTEALSQPNVTATRKTAGPKKPKPKSAAANKAADGKTKKKEAANVKTAAAAAKTTPQLVPTQSSTSPLQDISDHLNYLPIQACGEMTRRVLTSIYSLSQWHPTSGLS